MSAVLCILRPHFPANLRLAEHRLPAALVTGDYNELSDIISNAQPALVLLDLMLLDLMLPGTDGIELMERTPELADLPVIFISGYRRDETIARSLDSGGASTRAPQTIGVPEGLR